MIAYTISPIIDDKQIKNALYSQFNLDYDIDEILSAMFNDYDYGYHKYNFEKDEESSLPLCKLINIILRDTIPDYTEVLVYID